MVEVDNMLFDIPEEGFKTEAKFTTWLLSEIKKRGGFAFKLSDQDQRIKPCDAWVVYQGKSYAMELKMVHTMSCHPFRLLRGSSPSKPGGQVKGLQDHHKAVKSSGKSLVCVYTTKKNQYKIVDFSTIDFNSILTF